MISPPPSEIPGAPVRGQRVSADGRWSLTCGGSLDSTSLRSACRAYHRCQEARGGRRVLGRIPQPRGHTIGAGPAVACSGLPRGQYWCSRGRREHFRSLGAPLTEPRAGIRAGAGPEGRLRALNRQPPRGCPLSRPGHHRLGAQPGTARCTDAPERAPSQAPPPGRPSPDPDRTPPPGTGPGGLGGRGDGEGLLGRGRHGGPRRGDAQELAAGPRPRPAPAAPR